MAHSSGPRISHFPAELVPRACAKVRKQEALEERFWLKRRFLGVAGSSAGRQTWWMRPADQIVVNLSLPGDLVSFARACVASEDITRCVKLALVLLRRDTEELALDRDEPH